MIETHERWNVGLNAHDIGSLGNRLDVDGSSNIQTLHNLARSITDTFLGVRRNGMGWKNQRGISRVNTGIFDVLVNGSGNHLSVLNFTT